ncbi:hypothetical protein K8Q94_03260 [Candidatus Nomurabacteria bacterium]|nr:hypothetical protein [Candidatus Nomurabacteria bacterium]
MSKKRKKENSSDDIFGKILKDQRFRKEVVRNSFEFFFPIYMSQYMEYETAPFHEEMFRILEDDKIKLAVIVAFRGSAKSTLVSTAYVLWSILGVQQKKFIVLCGQTEQKARQHLSNIKEQLLHNELLKKDLGPFEEERNSLGNATAIIIKKLNVKIMICSTEQSIRGARHNQHRPDLIILDDIEDLDSVRTREGRNKTFNWLTGDVIPAGTKKTRIIAVGNLLHEDSVLRRLEKKIERGELKSMNPVFREYPIVDAKGVPLWPSKYPTPESIEAEHEKTMDEIAWLREYMLKIVASEEQIVTLDDIQYYDELPKGKPDRICIGVDLAISQKESADFPAFVVLYVYNRGDNLRVYVQPYPFHTKVGVKELLEHLKNSIAAEQVNKVPVKVFMENNGMQEAIVQLMQESHDIIGVPSVTDKASRLRIAAVPIKKKQVFFYNEGCGELIDELVGFGKENHDDLVDAFSISMIQIIEKYGKKPGLLFG